MSASYDLVSVDAETWKVKGNNAFRTGDLETAVASYSSGLEYPRSGGGDPSPAGVLLEATLLSNRAMCRLRAYETRAPRGGGAGKAANELRCCIGDCTAAIERLNACPQSTSASSGGKDTSAERDRLRGKVLFRRAKAYAIGHFDDSDGSGDGDEDALEKDLNASAKDLLLLLSFDPNNSEAANLLRIVRARHGTLGGGAGRCRISRALDGLRSATGSKKPGKGEGDDATTSGDGGKAVAEGEGGNEALRCLRTLQGSLAEHGAVAAGEIGRRGGVPELLRIALQRRPPRPIVGDGGEKADECGGCDGDGDGEEEAVKCRVAALHVLSVCCTHERFISSYGNWNQIPHAALAQIVEEESAAAVMLGGGEERSTNVAVAAIALLLRLVVHWDHGDAMLDGKIREDGTVERPSLSSEAARRQHVSHPEVDGPSVCRAASAALLWDARSEGGGKGGGGRAPRAALDLLAAWTASDLDAVQAAAVAVEAHSSVSSSSSTEAQRKRRQPISQEDVRRMKPRQVAAHRKREVEWRRKNEARAVRNVSMFCNVETGGMDALLTCAATARDHRLRREVGLQAGRLFAVIEDDIEVKKLVAPSLGFQGVIRDPSKDGDDRKSDVLTIEELDDEDEKEEEKFEDKVSHAHPSELDCQLLTSMKRGQLTASLLLGKPEVGTWALKEAWSNGGGISEVIGILIESGDPRAMSIASELVSAAASVEGSRPLLSTLIEGGGIDDLLSHPDPDVRSGAASCAAKIGLASKALSADEGEAMGLLDVAIELLYGEDNQALAEENLAEAVGTLSLVGGDKKGADASASPPSLGGSTSVERGIEILTYLVAKTRIKEKISGGYRPESSPRGRESALRKVVEVAGLPGRTQISYGLASIFNLLAVSSETLRKEAFIGKDVTKEQYDQLQALGKTEEEKEMDATNDESDGDTPAAVSERIRKMASAGIFSAMVNLLEGASDATQDKLLEAMARMASEQSVRGVMIQQGCLTACLHVDKGDKPNEIEKKILRQARSCVAKMLVTINPSILSVSQRSGSIGPLLKLVTDHDALDLMHFEALLSLTNLAGFGEETKDRIVSQKGIPALSYAMFSDHEMVRQAATEVLCNMIPHPEMMRHLAEPSNMRIWVAFASDFDEKFECARAAVGCLAMAVPDPTIAEALVTCTSFRDMVRSLSECGNLELMHRVLTLAAGLIEHGGKCLEAVIGTGTGPFCEAYVESYHDGKKADELNFSPSERGAFRATLSLAKEVAKALR